MKLFKRIDLWGQLALVAGILVDYFLTGNPGFGYYLVVGSWQLLSFFIHLFVLDNFYHSPHRRYYGIGLVVLAVAGLAFIPAILYYLVGILFVTPLFAGWYWYISYQEIILLNRKEFIHLK